MEKLDVTVSHLHRATKEATWLIVASAFCVSNRLHTVIQLTAGAALHSTITTKML